MRQEAQFALAAKQKDAIEPLSKVAKDSKNPLARLHALWGLGQIGRKEPKAHDGIVAVIEDKDTHVPQSGDQTRRGQPHCRRLRQVDYAVAR